MYLVTQLHTFDAWTFSGIVFAPNVAAGTGLSGHKRGHWLGGLMARKRTYPPRPPLRCGFLLVQRENIRNATFPSGFAIREDSVDANFRYITSGHRRKRKYSLQGEAAQQLDY